MIDGGSTARHQPGCLTVRPAAVAPGMAASGRVEAGGLVVGPEGEQAAQVGGEPRISSLLRPPLRTEARPPIPTRRERRVNQTVAEVKIFRTARPNVPLAGG